MSEFKYASPSQIYAAQNEFGDREAGITHPDTNGFIKLCDNGDLEIVAGEGVSILMSARARTITFVADTVKFLTRREGGIRWNRLVLNDKARVFTEPTFLDYDDEFINGIYRDVDHYNANE